MTGPTTMQRLAENTGWLVLQAAGSRLLSFVLNIMIVRYLGAAGYGELSFAMAFAGFFTILGDFGLSTYTLKEVSADKTAGPDLFGRGAGLNVFLSAVITLLLVSVPIASGMDGRVRLCVLLIGVSYLLRQTGGFAAVFFRAHERMSLLFSAESAYMLLLIAFCGACVLLRLGITAITAAYAAASAVYAASVIFVVARMVLPRFSIRLDGYFSMLRASVPYGLSSAALVVYYNADILMLSHFKGSGEVGIYSVAYRLYLTLGIIVSVYMGAAFPVLSRLFKSSPEGLRRAYSKSFKFLLIIAIPVSFGAVLLSRNIITAVYGTDFSASAAPFAMLSSVTVFLYLNAFLGHFFAAIGRVRDSLFMLCAACLVNIVLNLLLIPSYGCLGAAISTVVSEVAFFIMAAVYFSRTEYHFMPWGLVARLAAFSAVMAGLLRWLGWSNVFALSAAGALLYALFVLFGGVLDGEDRGLIREAFKL